VVPIENELIMDGLVDSVRILRRLWELVGLRLLVQDFGLELAGGTGFELFGVVQRHRFSRLD
jgi:hypothetical protein